MRLVFWIVCQLRKQLRIIGINNGEIRYRKCHHEEEAAACSCPAKLPCLCFRRDARPWASRGLNSRLFTRTRGYPGLHRKDGTVSTGELGMKQHGAQKASHGRSAVGAQEGGPIYRVFLEISNELKCVFRVTNGTFFPNASVTAAAPFRPYNLLKVQNSQRYFPNIF